MQVGDAFVGIDHGQLRLAVVDRLNVGFDLCTLVVGQSGYFGNHVTKAIIDIDTQCAESICIFLEYWGKKYFHSDTKHNRV